MAKAVLLTTNEVANQVGVDRRTVHRWVRKGYLDPAVRAPGIRGAMMFRLSDVNRLVRKRSKKAA